MTREKAGCLIQECGNNAIIMTEETFDKNIEEVVGRYGLVIVGGIDEIRDKEIHDGYIAILRCSCERLKRLGKGNVQEAQKIIRALWYISV